MNPAILKKIDFFDGLSLSELNRISPYISYQSYSTGQRIFDQDTAAEFMYLLCEGTVEIVFNPDDGPPMRVTTIYQGGIFGWSAAMGTFLYTSGAECKEDCRTLKMRGSDLNLITKKYPDLGSLLLDRLAAVVSERWESRQTQINSMLKKRAFLPKSGIRREMEVSPVENNELSVRIDQMKGLVEQLSAYIEHYHGGSVEFESFDGKNLKVSLGGACLGCPLSQATLHGWVEGTVKQFFPDIESVEAV